MKCPNCGADMKDGLLYCECCGEDIHIVPDFEPEVEYNLEQTLSDIVKDINGSGEPLKPEPEIPEGEAESGDVAQDWDHGKSHIPKKKRHLLLYWLIGVLIVLVIVSTALAVAYYRHNSLEYQVKRAEFYTTEAEYENAILSYSRALELDPENIELKFALAEVFFLKNNKIEYEYLLRDIVSAENATMEQLESAYGKLIAIYRAREDYKTINELLMDSNNESIMSIYQSYLSIEPEFSVNEGYYTSIQPLKLTTFGTGKIYYTMDGSEPDENSQLYTAPILLENGDYCIKAIYVNENGISSEVVSKEYHVEIQVLPPPEISVNSGDYQSPLNIEVVDKDVTVYYTTDGSTPSEQSNLYTGAIPMPLGESVFKFITIQDGKSSEVVERYYNLKMDTPLSTQDAVNKAIDYALEIEKIDDETGRFDKSGSVYKYEYQYVINISGVSDFYIISEILVDIENISTRTGTVYAVDAYTGEIYKIQRDEQNNYILVEIE